MNECGVKFERHCDCEFKAVSAKTATAFILQTLQQHAASFQGALRVVHLSVRDGDWIKSANIFI